MLARWFSIIAAVMVVAGLTGADTALARSDDGSWVPIAKRLIDFKSDRIVIPVSGKAGQFTRIKLRAPDARVSLHRIKIFYANGAVEDVSIEMKLRKGDETRPIDLAGGGRNIRQIELVYRPRRKFRRQASIVVLGLKQASKPDPVAVTSKPKSTVVKLDDGWDLLGEKRVDFGVDRDVIKVGARANRYNRIRLRAEENNIYLYDVRVRYMNGAVEDIRVDQDLHAGARTSDFDLVGKGRLIRNIELIYRSGSKSRGRALVRVLGRVQLDRITEKPKGWDVLGQRRVGFNTDHDVVKVGLKEGQYTRIMLRARDADIFVDELKVVYGNGVVDVLRVGERLRAGAATRPIDLTGKGRNIQRIEMIYRSRKGSNEHAVVEIFGLPAPKDAWKKLGAKIVGFRLDRDIIRVGEMAGTFRRIKLRVLDNEIYIVGFKVIYGNGSVEDWKVGARVPAGSETNPIDLRGRGRIINAIALLYQSRPSFQGKATVEVFGLH